MNNTVLEKIKKLLALATRNTNQAEMESAMAKAIELATQHDIDLATVELAGQKVRREYIKENIPMGARLPVCGLYIRWILQKHFNVKVLVSGNRAYGRSMVLVGTDTDIDTAKFVYDFLSERFMSLWQGHHKRTGCAVQSRDSYFLGMHAGLDDKLERQRKTTEETIAPEVAQSYGLMVVSKTEELTNAVSKFFPELRTAPKKRFNNCDSGAYYAGQAAGASLNIARGIGN